MDFEYDLTSLPSHISLKNLFFTLCGFAIVKYRSYLYWPIHAWQSPLRYLNGPKNDSFLFGHFFRLTREEGGTIYEDWTEKHGKTLTFRGFFGSYQLCTTDMRAIHYIMTHSDTFQRPEAGKFGTELVLGKGLITVDLDTHKKQRRIMNPSFGASQLRNLVPIFMEKSKKLRDAWVDLINNNPDGPEIDVLFWLSRATLDIIGSAGFGHEFDSLQNWSGSGLAGVFDITPELLIKAILRRFFPLPTKGKLDATHENMRQIGKQLIADKKSIIQSDTNNNTELQGRDLLTLLIKSNMMAEMERGHENQTMSDEEVLGQITTFFVAGHETSATTTTWALYELTQHPEVQARLRHELQNCGLGEEPSMSDLDKLPYLDAFVRETLRLHAVVPTIGRQATTDIVVPVGQEFKDIHGVVHKEIRMQKGDTVLVPILAMNRSKDVWGEDSMEFRPERWNDLPEAVKETPGVWGNLMTFSLGSHSCIGFRFAIIEIKALLYSLVQSIEFGIDPKHEVESVAGVISIRPCVKSKSSEGDHLLLKCKLSAPM